MKKLFTFLLALMASSCLWAEITYELNGGKHNDYEWKDKGDMFAAFMTDAGATGFETLEYYMQQTDPLKSPNICAKLTDASPALKMAKWAWLKAYIEAAHTSQAANGASSLPSDGTGAAWRYAVGAFFASIQQTGWPKSADFTELGKDAAYIPAWGQNYPNPTDPTEEVTLVAPYRAGYLFDGWYASADFSGEKVTTVDQNTTGTLYAKWVSDGIVYELNGGKYNDYGWTSKADICLDLQKDYNSTYSTAWSWVKKESGVILYCVDKNANTSNRDWQWMTENDAKGTSLIATKLYADTYRASDAPARLMPLVETTMKEKYGWLKDFITANRTAQSMTGDLSTLGETFYRAEIAAFFYCSPAYTSYPKSSSYETTGDYEDFQPYWGQAFPNPEHPTEEVTLHAPFKEGCKFLGWYDNEACTGTPVTKVDQNYKGTLYAKWVLDGIAYELNGGVWNEYGWEDKGDMYKAILKDINDITPPTQSGTNVNTITLEEDKTKGVKSGIPTYWNDLTVLLTHETFNTKWGWLVAYMDAVCSTQSRTKPSTDQAALRYNLSAFFMDDHYASWPYSADYTTAGKVEAFQYTWGQSFPGIEHPTESTVLHIAYKQRHNFEGWYDNEECTGTAITTVDENYAGTLYAKWSLAPVLYNLNGGQYNKYGWETKEDIYNDFLKDWKAYEGEDANSRGITPYKNQLGVGKGHTGIPTTINSTAFRDALPAMFTHADYQAKWGWLATYLDAVAAQQGKTQPTTSGATLTFSLGNFFGEDKNSNYTAVDFTGEAKELYMAQSYCSFTLPNPMYPTKEVTLNNPTKEGYIFEGWYTTADFSGAAVTKVNEDTKGTLYAKWKEDAYTRDVTNGNYGTICLPKGSKQTSGAIFYELAYKDARYVYLDQVTTLEAGVPYIFKATSSQLKVVYNTTEVTVAGNHNGLYGTFVEIQDAATSDPNNVLEGNYLLVSNTIKKCGVNCKVLANRAYIKLEEIPNSASAAPGRNRVSMKYEGENEATGLDNITEDSNINPALQGTYDIMGRKLTEPSTTGIYIVNGKKVIIVK